MPAGFQPGQGNYATRDPELRFEMTEKNGSFYETAVRATPTVEERASANIALVYGSGGAADEIYFTWHGDHLNELPMAWLHPLKRWGEQPFNPYMAGDLARSTTPRCLECHNTWVAHTPGTDNQYARESLLLGVTCERCHGPGAEHVAFHTVHSEADSAHKIVRPAQLSRDRQIDLCGQCHSNAVKRRGPAFSYRPGEPLDNYFRTNLNKRREEDHVANQVHYLQQSKCFQKSDNLTCTTCHDPHRPPSSSNGAAQRTCAKCHPPEHCKEQSRLPAGVRGDCVGCHMPRFTRIQVFFHTSDDQYVPAIRPHNHQIAIYQDASREVLLAWHNSQPDAKNQRDAMQLKDALVKHWSAQAGKFDNEHRFMAEIAALREAYRIGAMPDTREKLRKITNLQARLDRDMFTAQNQMDRRDFSGAMQTLRNVLAVKPDWAKAHGKLGTCCAIAGRFEEAAEHLQAVAENDPDDAYGYAMLGWIAYLQDRPADAVEYYRRADAVEPYVAKTNYQLGLALAKLGRWPQAIEAFRRVLAIDPNHADARQSLRDALERKGKNLTPAPADKERA
jgi:tetratricopeptide (TPR) repeat protein